MASEVNNGERRRPCHNFSINSILDLSENTSNSRPADGENIENLESKLNAYSTAGRVAGSWSTPPAGTLERSSPFATRQLAGSNVNAHAHTGNVTTTPTTATVARQPLPAFITGYFPQRQQTHVIQQRQILSVGVPRILPFTWGPAGCDWSGRRRRKSRTVFTSEQLLLLEKKFEETRYLSMTDRFEIARRLGLSEQQIKTWFQNRRTKWKKFKGPGDHFDGSSEMDESDHSMSPPVRVLSPET